MRGFVDLHCHWVPGIDDGAPTLEQGVEMLERLYAAGFSRVIATPHMRPGMFDNTRDHILRAFEQSRAATLGKASLPMLELGSEHYFDDVTYGRLLAGEGVPYPGGKAVLLEFYDQDFPPMLTRHFSELRRRGLLPVIAHPERYRKIWKQPEILESLIDGGAAALLDTAALVGKYGREPQRSAELLLEQGLYHAACSDAHRPADVDHVSRGMARIEQLYGADELTFLFASGPAELLAGRLPE